MKFSIVLLFISFNVISFMHIDEGFGIKLFLKLIKDNGLYYLLKEIKCAFGAYGPEVANRGLSYLLSN